MAVTAFMYGKSYANFLGGEAGGDTFQTDFLTDTIKVMLTTSTYTENLDTHETKADVTNEVVGTGYTAGGATLASKTITYTAAASWATTWAATTAYAVGDVVRKVSSNGHLYRCIVAGTSAGSEPAFPTTSGQTVTDNTVTWAEIGRGITQIDAADTTWASSTITARKAVGYRSTGTDSTSPLFFLQDFGADVSTTAGTFQLTWHVLGMWVHTSP